MEVSDSIRKVGAGTSRFKNLRMRNKRNPPISEGVRNNPDRTMSSVSEVRKMARL